MAQWNGPRPSLQTVVPLVLLFASTPLLLYVALGPLLRLLGSYVRWQSGDKRDLIFNALQDEAVRNGTAKDGESLQNPTVIAGFFHPYW
jgi:hypothetical protein